MRNPESRLLRKRGVGGEAGGKSAARNDETSSYLKARGREMKGKSRLARKPQKKIDIINIMTFFLNPTTIGVVRVSLLRHIRGKNK